jgi:hypothetical protein
MRILANTISPLINLWSAVYVSALLSAYTFVAGMLAHNRAAAQSPAKPIRKQLWIKPGAIHKPVNLRTAIP